MYGVTLHAINLALALPLYFRRLTVISTAKQNFIYRVFQEKILPLRENISYFNLHRYEQTHLYPILKVYTDSNE